MVYFLDLFFVDHLNLNIRTQTSIIATKFKKTVFPVPQTVSTDAGKVFEQNKLQNGVEMDLNFRINSVLSSIKLLISDKHIKSTGLLWFVVHFFLRLLN